MKILRTCIGSMISYGLVKELQKAGIEVIGLDSDPNCYAFQKLDCYVVPKADDREYIHRILDIIELEQPDAILCGAEEELEVLLRNKPHLGDVIILAPKYHYLLTCMDKRNLHDFFMQMNIPTPRSGYSLDYASITKPRFGRGGKGNIEYLIIQEYIKGIEYSVDILADREGNTLNIVPRIREKVIDGKSVISKTIYDKEIMNYCKKIVKELRLFGPSCIQCIKNDSGVYFIDVNPRFGGGSILSVMADPSILPNLMKLIEGEKVMPCEGFEEGLTMKRYYKEVYSNGN